MSYHVYILTTRKNTVLYTGTTGDLMQRVWQHKQGLVKGFTKDYSVTKLVYMEEYADSREAIHREKCIKEWKRDWKIQLIEKANPGWLDLYSLQESGPGFRRDDNVDEYKEVVAG